jgi:hypothetical protein
MDAADRIHDFCLFYDHMFAVNDGNDIYVLDDLAVGVKLNAAETPTYGSSELRKASGLPCCRYCRSPPLLF